MYSKPTKEDWNKLIQSYGPYKYLLTITYKYSISDFQAEQLLQHLFRFTSRNIYGPRAMKKDRYLKGFVFTERQDKRKSTEEVAIQQALASNKFISGSGTWTAKQAMRSNNQGSPLHFHILIKDDSWIRNLTADELKAKVMKSARHLKKKSTTGHDYSVLNHHGVDVTEVYYEQGIVDYLLKTYWKNGDKFISPLGLHGAVVEPSLIN